MVGFLNFDVWHWFVGYLVDDMRIKRDFPNNPDVSDIISSAADTACVSYSLFQKSQRLYTKALKNGVKNANADSCFGLQWNPSKPTSL